MLFPLYFILMFLLFILGGLGISVLIYIVSFPEARSIPGLLNIHMGSVFPGILTGAFLVTWVWAWSRIRKYIQKSSLVTLSLIVISTLVLGMLSFLGALWYPEQPTSLGHGISSRSLHGNSQLLIRSHNSGPIILDQVYVRQLYPQQPGRFLPRVVFDGSSQELLIPGFIENLEQETEIESTGLSRILDELRGLVSPLSVTSIETTLRASISLHPILQQLVAGIYSLGLVLIQYGADLSYRLFFMAGAFSIFCAGAGLFQKGTGWPFWGTFLGLGVTAGGVVLLDFFFSPDIQDLASSFLQPRAMAYLGPGILGGLGLLFGFVSLITSPLPKPSAPGGGGKRGRLKEPKENQRKEKKKKNPKPIREKQPRNHRDPKPPKAKKAPKAEDDDLISSELDLDSEFDSDLDSEFDDKINADLDPRFDPSANLDQGPGLSDGFDEIEFHEIDEDSAEDLPDPLGGNHDGIANSPIPEPLEFDPAEPDDLTFDEFTTDEEVSFDQDTTMDEDDTFSFGEDFGNFDDPSLDSLDELEEEKL